MLDSSYSLLRFWDQGFFVDVFYIIFFLILIVLEPYLQLRAMVLPHKIIFKEARLSTRHISATILSLLERPKVALQIK